MRQSVMGALAGLSEYDVRSPPDRDGDESARPHQAPDAGRVVYLGEIFDRPFPEQHPRFDDPDYRNRDSLWARDHESLAIDASGHVPWWPRPDVKLFNVMVHVLTETNRDAGHAEFCESS